MEPQLSSFDVFETLVVRDTSRPEGMYAEIGSAIARYERGAVSEGVATSARYLAERLAYAARDPTTTLRDIAAQVSWLLTGASDRADEYAKLEENAERRSLRAVAENVALLSTIRDRGGRIAYLSDTPHRSAFLGSVLTDLGIRAPDEPVFTSCELGATKASGRAYRRVAQLLGVRPARMRHYGDNLHADVRMARIAGVPGRHVGTSHRPPVPPMGAEATYPAPVEINAMTDLLWSFVGWTLLEAKGRGVETLLFVGRDGYLPLRIARRLVRRWGVPMEVGYLPFSRNAASELATSADARSAARHFLARRLSNRQFALVDLGWLGNAMSELLTSLAALELPAPSAFYVMGYYGEPGSSLPVVSFLNEARHRNGVVLRPGSIRLLEATSTATTGTVVTFNQFAHGARPVLARSVLFEEDKLHVRRLQYHVLEGVGGFHSDHGLVDSDRSRLRVQGVRAALSLESRLGSPTVESARELSQTPVEDRGNRTTLARAYGARDVVRTIIRRQNREPRIWVAGSWAVSPPWLRVMRSAARRARATPRMTWPARALLLRIEDARARAEKRDLIV